MTIKCWRLVAMFVIFNKMIRDLDVPWQLWSFMAFFFAVDMLELYVWVRNYLK